MVGDLHAVGNSYSTPRLKEAPSRSSCPVKMSGNDGLCRAAFSSHSPSGLKEHTPSGSIAMTAPTQCFVSLTKRRSFFFLRPTTTVHGLPEQSSPPCAQQQLDRALPALHASVLECLDVRLEDRVEMEHLAMAVAQAPCFWMMQQLVFFWWLNHSQRLGQLLHVSLPLTRKLYQRQGSALTVWALIGEMWPTTSPASSLLVSPTPFDPLAPL